MCIFVTQCHCYSQRNENQINKNRYIHGKSISGVFVRYLRGVSVKDDGGTLDKNNQTTIKNIR